MEIRVVFMAILLRCRQGCLCLRGCRLGLTERGSSLRTLDAGFRHALRRRFGVNTISSCSPLLHLVLDNVRPADELG
jgi:hypothetical protein